MTPLLRRPSGPRRASLTVDARPEDLPQVRTFIEGELRATRLTERARREVRLGVDEACANIIEHAYGPDRPGQVTLTCCVASQGDLVITIHDHGRPFDPTDVPDPPIGAELEDLPEGGLGLYFMRKLMDQVTFRFDKEQGNVLTMVKRRPK